MIRIAGQRVRSQPVETTLASLRAAKAAGVKVVMFTSDNFNKVPEVEALLAAMIEEKLELPFFAQCDAQVHREEGLVELLARAGCFQMFVGAESFSPETLREAHKLHNDPERTRGSWSSAGVTASRATSRTSSASRATRRRGSSPTSGGSGSWRPTWRLFYLLTPIPGTEQYEDFLEEGLVTERNLDRFDGSAVTWRHPNLPDDRLRSLVVRAYREFYGARDVASKVAGVFRRTRDFRRGQALYAVLGYSALSRLAVLSATHPMAGGVGRVRLDRAEDYAALRRSVFGLDRAPLPHGLRSRKRTRRATGGRARPR